MTDLNTLVGTNAPLYLLIASSINSRGQIAGFGVTRAGDIHAFLASPTYLSSSNGAKQPTAAVVSPLNLTADQSSVVLDGSGSTSAAADLQYSFVVAPGGKQAALLQSPADPKATVQFVSGSGTYLIQLIVTDAQGNTSKSPVVTLNYQPS